MGMQVCYHLVKLNTVRGKRKMFCPKCGTQVMDDTNFCPKCGAAVASYSGRAADASSPQSQNTGQPAAQPFYARSQASAAPPAARRKLAVQEITALVIVALMIIGLIAGEKEQRDQIDYVATVKAFPLFNEGYGFSCTCEEVFDSYIDSVQWSERESGETHYITASGIAKWSGYPIEITLTAKKDSTDDEAVRITLEPMKIDGDGYSQEMTNSVMYVLFYARDKNYDYTKIPNLLEQMIFLELIL